MSKICPIPPLGFDDSSIDEQFDFVQSHRVLIAATSEQVPLAEWHQEIIRERLAVYLRAPAPADSGQTSESTSSASYTTVDLTE